MSPDLADNDAPFGSFLLKFRSCPPPSASRLSHSPRVDAATMIEHRTAMFIPRSWGPQPRGDRREALIRKEYPGLWLISCICVQVFYKGQVLFAHATAVRVSACVKKLVDLIQCLLVGSRADLVKFYLSSHFGPRLSSWVVT